MTNFSKALSIFLVGAALSSPAAAFAPTSFGVSQSSTSLQAAATKKAKAKPIEVSDADVTKLTGKPTGTSFLPEEAVERAKIGSPIEKIKQRKDATAAFVDVYEYARKIREGEMTWEDVEKADLDTVSNPILCCMPILTRQLTLVTSATEIRWYAPSWQAYSRSIHDAFEGTKRHCQL